MNGRWSGLLSLCAAGLIMAGCRPAPPEERGPAAAGEAPGARSFVIPSLKGGGEIALDDYRGKVVLLDFWATWCPPCRSEMPALNRLYDEYRQKGFAIIGMTVDRGTVEQVAAAVSRFPIRYPLGLAGGKVQADYGGIRAVPTKFLLDRQGRIRRHFVGVVPERYLRSSIEALLAENAS